MSEIEKMYKTAKVVPSHHYCNDCQYNMSAECPIRCHDNVAVYPPFTAEKQIELICFLLNADIKIDICKDSNIKMEICDIAEALAEVTNTIWQDLTEEEKQQVKGILE